MFKTFKNGMSAIALLAASAGAVADTASLAVGSGWCSNGGYCGNTHTQTFSNTFAGNHAGLTYRNWFAFDIATEHVAAAKVSIWSDGRNFSDDPLAVYSLHATTGFSFDGLMDGPSFGSITANIANTGNSHSVDIVFNAYGVDFLNAHLGTRVVFGGNVASTASNVQFFGHTDGFPTAYINTIGTVSHAPEPESYVLMLAGLGLIGAATRRRQKRAAYRAL